MAAKFTGSLSDRVAKQLADEWARLIRDRPPGAFAIFVNLLEWEGGSPAAVGAAYDLYDRAAASGAVALVYAVPADYFRQGPDVRVQALRDRLEIVKVYASGQLTLKAR